MCLSHPEDARHVTASACGVARQSGSGLGVYRWVIERTNYWLHQFRRPRVRYERRVDIHQAFLTIGCITICWNALDNPLC